MEQPISQFGAVSGLFGVPVDWDGGARSVLLGKEEVNEEAKVEVKQEAKETLLRDLKPSSIVSTSDALYKLPFN